MQPLVDGFSSAIGGCQPEFVVYFSYLKKKKETAS